MCGTDPQASEGHHCSATAGGSDGIGGSQKAHEP